MMKILALSVLGTLAVVPAQADSHLSSGYSRSDIDTSLCVGISEWTGKISGLKSAGQVLQGELYVAMPASDFQRIKQAGTVERARHALTADQSQWVADYLRARGDAGVPVWVQVGVAGAGFFLAPAAGVVIGVGQTYFDWALSSSDSTVTARTVAERVAPGGEMVGYVAIHGPAGQERVTYSSVYEVSLGDTRPRHLICSVTYPVAVE